MIGILREGLSQVRRSPQILRILVIVSALAGVTSLDEYLSLLVRGMGVTTSFVPLFEVLVTAAMAVGGWFVGRGTHLTAPILTAGALCLATGAALGSPAGFILIALSYGIFQWTMTTTEAHLQNNIPNTARATITSLSALGSEALTLLTFATYALGSLWTPPWQIFTLAAAPYMLIALLLRRRR